MNYRGGGRRGGRGQPTQGCLAPTLIMLTVIALLLALAPAGMFGQTVGYDAELVPITQTRNRAAAIESNASYTLAEQRAINATYRVGAPDGSKGSGVAITPRILITNHHVVRNDATGGVFRTVTIEHHLRGTTASGAVLTSWRMCDLAVVFLDSDVAHTELSNVIPDPGYEVVHLGHPRAGPLQIGRGKIVSDRGTHDRGGRYRTLTFDSLTIGGDSGGGLFDHEGNLIGTVYAKGVDDGGYGRASPMEQIMQVAEAVEAQWGRSCPDCEPQQGPPFVYPQQGGGYRYGPAPNQPGPNPRRIVDPRGGQQQPNQQGLRVLPYLRKSDLEDFAAQLKAAADEREARIRADVRGEVDLAILAAQGDIEQRATAIAADVQRQADEARATIEVSRTEFATQSAAFRNELDARVAEQEQKAAVIREQIESRLAAAPKPDVLEANITASVTKTVTNIMAAKGLGLPAGVLTAIGVSGPVGLGLSIAALWGRRRVRERFSRRGDYDSDYPDRRCQHDPYRRPGGAPQPEFRGVG